jgi:hypothetical protein
VIAVTDTEAMTKNQVLAKLREEVAELRGLADAESDAAR